MNTATTIGFVIMLAGVIIAGDAKSFGMKTPSAGIAVGGVGFMVAVFGYFGGTAERNQGTVNRKVRNHSV
jgi:hypothetical protein